MISTMATDNTYTIATLMTGPFIYHTHDDKGFVGDGDNIF